jgi:hypothetical protein
MAKHSASDTEGVIKLIVGVVHLIATEGSLQTPFIKWFVVGNEGQALYQWFYLCPYLGEDAGVLGVLTAEAMNLTAPVVIVVRLWLDEGVVSVNYLTIADDDDADGADAAALVVGGFEVYCCKVFHLFILLVF